MSAYTKFFAAVIATLLSRWMLRYLGLDVEAMGVSVEFQTMVELAVDAAVAGFNGFWVYLLPNKSKSGPVPTEQAVNIKVVDPHDTPYGDA